jgi:hypothetical protein
VTVEITATQIKNPTIGKRRMILSLTLLKGSRDASTGEVIA